MLFERGDLCIAVFLKHWLSEGSTFRASCLHADFGPCLPRAAAASLVPSCAQTGSTSQPARPRPPAREQRHGGFNPCSCGEMMGSQCYCKEDRHSWIISQQSENECDNEQTFPQWFPLAAPCLLGISIDHIFSSHCPFRSQVAFFHQALAQPEKGQDWPNTASPMLACRAVTSAQGFQKNKHLLLLLPWISNINLLMLVFLI